MSHGKSVTVGIGVFILAIAAVVIIAGIGLGIRYFLAEPTGRVQMEENVTSGRAQENSYNYFFDQCAAIQGYEASLTATRQALDTAKTQADVERLSTVLVATAAERGRAIAKYNTDVRKAATLARFKANGLPEFINVANPETSCQN